MGARVVNRQEKRDQVLTAALKVFGGKGFSKTTISDIAIAAGMGKGTVYEYFSTKEEIIEQSFGYFMRILSLDFEHVVGADMPALDKLHAIFNGFAEFMDEGTRELMELMFDFWSEGIKNKHIKGILYTEMVTFYRSYRGLFADILVQGMSEGVMRKDINPHSAASLLVGALDGIMVQWILDRETFDYPDVIKTIGLTFLDGILLKRE